MHVVAFFFFYNCLNWILYRCLNLIGCLAWSYRLHWDVYCSGVTVIKKKKEKKKSFQTAEMLLKNMVLVTVQQSVAAHSCLLFTFPQSRLALKVALISLHACSIFFLFSLPPPHLPSLAQPLLFSMCNLKLICTTGYLTGATDTESVLFLLKHSMELTLNLNKTNLN